MEFLRHHQGQSQGKLREFCFLDMLGTLIGILVAGSEKSGGL